MMTDTKLSTRVQMAQNVREWLHSKGSSEVATVFYNRRARIEISCPPAELLERAQCISERYAGGTRNVWTAFYNGCQIIWR